LGNFSKFIRPGFVRITATDSPVSGVTISAYYGNRLKRLVIVTINSHTEITLGITTPGITGDVTIVPWLTDDTHRLERQQPVDYSGNGFNATLPSQSIVTFVLQDVAISPE